MADGAHGFRIAIEIKLRFAQVSRSDMELRRLPSKDNTGTGQHTGNYTRAAIYGKIVKPTVWYLPKKHSIVHNYLFTTALITIETLLLTKG